MRYDFTDIGEAALTDRTSENQLIYNGVNFDDTLTDSNRTFITLNIDGRGIADYKHNIIEPPGSEGSLFESVFLQSRTLEVEVQISAVDAVTFRETLEELNRLLRSQSEVPIQFSDEPEHTYYGIYTSNSRPKDDSNEQVLTMTLHCSNPFKESSLKTINYTNASVLTVDSFFPVTPYIEVIFPEATHEFSVHNTTQEKTIAYKRVDGFNTQNYHLEIDENRIHRSTNQTDGYSGLVLSSDWEDFTIETGDQLVVHPEPQSIKIHYRGVKL